jgi:hypothetical protein
MASCRAGFEKWLARDNQPKSGQIKTLEACRALVDIKNDQNAQ